MTISSKAKHQYNKSVDNQVKISTIDEEQELKKEIESLKYKYKLKKRGKSALSTAIQIKASYNNINSEGKRFKEPNIL